MRIGRRFAITAAGAGAMNEKAELKRLIEPAGKVNDGLPAESNERSDCNGVDAFGSMK